MSADSGYRFRIFWKTGHVAVSCFQIASSLARLTKRCASYIPLPVLFPDGLTAVLLARSLNMTSYDYGDPERDEVDPDPAFAQFKQMQMDIAQIKKVVGPMQSLAPQIIAQLQ